MRHSHNVTVLALLASTVVLLTMSGPADSGQTSRGKGTKVDAVSVDVEPRIEPFRTTPEPARLLPRVPSRGDCAPRYGNGTLGTCINDMPCRGFGVVDGKRVSCACFVKLGGCDEGERCEAREARCVKDDAPDFNLHP